MLTYENFIKKIKDLRAQYESGQLKINMAGITTLVMSGAMDSLMDKQVTLDDRLLMINMAKKVLESKVELAEGKKGAMGTADIVDEFSRFLWMSQVNPLFRFKMCDHFSSALKAMGFTDTGKPSMRYRSGDVDIFGSFATMFEPRCLAYYSNKNVQRRPAIVAIYKGYETKTWGEGKKLRKLKLLDGSEEMEGIIWPRFGTSDEFPEKLNFAMNSYRGKVCLVFGKIGSNRGFRSFTVSEIMELS